VKFCQGKYRQAGRPGRPGRQARQAGRPGRQAGQAGRPGSKPRQADRQFDIKSQFFFFLWQ